MKNIKLFAGIFLFLTAFTFTSCENEPLDPALNLDDFNNPPAGPVAFRADFSGATWSTATAQAAVSGNMIQIVAVKPNGEGFGFIIDGAAVGTYPANENLLAYTPAGSEFSYWSTNINDDTEDTGSITITSINTTAHTISGTFNFKGYWSDADNTSILPIIFTNGVFENLPYEPGTASGDTFFAKVNGTEFVDTDILALTIDVAGQEFISVAGRDANLDAITVSVKSNIGPGTYTITGDTATDLVQAIYDFDGDNYQALTGSVTIISKTATHIKGTFTCVTEGAPAPFNITEGAFDVEY